LNREVQPERRGRGTPRCQSTSPSARPAPHIPHETGARESARGTLSGRFVVGDDPELSPRGTGFSIAIRVRDQLPPTAACSRTSRRPGGWVAKFARIDVRETDATETRGRASRSVGPEPAHAPSSRSSGLWTSSPSRSAIDPRIGGGAPRAPELRSEEEEARPAPLRVSSTRIALASAPPRTCTSSSPKADEQRPRRRAACRSPRARPPGAMPALGEEPKASRDPNSDTRVNVPRAPPDPQATAGSRLLPSSIVSPRGSGSGRSRAGRLSIAELGGDQLFELFGQHMLEHLRLLVHAIPRHAEGVLDEVQLEQAVVAHHPRAPPRRAVVSQRHAPCTAS